MLNEKIIDIQTGEETIRPYTKEEIAQVEIEIAKRKEIEDLIAEQTIAKQALFAKLGITEDEAKLLLS